MNTVPLEQLEALASQFPPEPPKQGGSGRGSGGPFDLDRWIAGHGIEVRYQAPWGTGRKWVLERCVWNPEHDDKSAYIVQHQGGAIGAGCHHNSCQGKGWPDLREVFEPGYRDREPRRANYIGAFPTVNSHGGAKGSAPPVVLDEELPQAPRQFVLRCLDQQEYGDAQLFAHLYQNPQRLAYDHSAQQWHAWGGNYWLLDKTARVRRLVAGQVAA